MVREWKMPRGARVIDVGAPDAALGQQLASQGHTQYLALTSPDRVDAAGRQAPDMANRFHPLLGPGQVFRNTADLLVLRSSHARFLWSWREITHARLIAVEEGWGEGRLAASCNRLLSDVSLLGRMTVGGATFQVLELPGWRGPAVRTYFSQVWGPAGLAERLEKAGLSYIVLRWFDQLPHMDEGEDLDVLVADKDLTTFRELVAQEPGTVPMDVYSVSGLPHSDFQGAAYYPPALSAELLADAELHRSGFRVPSAEGHLHSLAYHAVYHKGLRSGIPSVGGQAPDGPPEHDYLATLNPLAASLGVSLPSTLEGMDDYLASVGWRPPVDALRRLVHTNPWLAGTLDRQEEAHEGPEVTVFLVREATLDTVPLGDVLASLEHHGFDRVHVHELDPVERERCARAIRGGNWGPGPFPRSGGRPAVVVVALHHGPQPVPPRLQHQYPHLTNMATYEAKQELRELIQRHTVEGAEFNPIHSSDNEHESWEYLDLVLPGTVDSLRAEIEVRRAEYASDVPVLSVLSTGRRARVEVVAGPDGPVVRKTFARGYLRYLEREVAAMRELHGVIPAVPPVLDRGPNWFTTPYYRDSLGVLDPAPGGRLVPLEVSRQMVAVLRQLYDRGYDLVDAKPQNFLLDPDEGLKLLDFEFLHRYPEDRRPPFAESYNFVGTPADFDGDVPVGDQTYEVLWQPFTGLPREVLVDGSPASQRRHLRLHLLKQATVAPGSPARRPLRAAKDVARQVKGTVRTAYGRWAVQRAQSLSSAP